MRTLPHDSDFLIPTYVFRSGRPSRGMIGSRLILTRVPPVPPAPTPGPDPEPSPPRPEPLERPEPPIGEPPVPRAAPPIRA